MELIAEYDPFLKNHIENHGNPGSGHVSYLSKTICEEFIQLLHEKILEKIVKELKENKYYSITVDSTPDISHMDQLTFVFRYVTENGDPVSRFIKFIKLDGHTAEEMEIHVLSTLSLLGIDLNDMRGQSYDNASNMSGCYSLKKNILALYVACSNHSLNLVGSSAAGCCLQATKYFMFLQQLYVFFSDSTSRWDRVKKKI